MGERRNQRSRSRRQTDNNSNNNYKRVRLLVLLTIPGAEAHRRTWWRVQQVNFHLRNGDLSLSSSEKTLTSLKFNTPCTLATGLRHASIPLPNRPSCSDPAWPRSTVRPPEPRCQWHERFSLYGSTPDVSVCFELQDWQLALCMNLLAKHAGGTLLCIDHLGPAVARQTIPAVA